MTTKATKHLTKEGLESALRDALEREEEKDNTIDFQSETIRVQSETIRRLYVYMNKTTGELASNLDKEIYFLEEGIGVLEADLDEPQISKD